MDIAEILENLLFPSRCSDQDASAPRAESIEEKWHAQRNTSGVAAIDAAEVISLSDSYRLIARRVAVRRLRLFHECEQVCTTKTTFASPAYTKTLKSTRVRPPAQRGFADVQESSCLAYV